ncbi:MAG: redox-regulated ATPase YchF [Puniceicoccales bacterium]|jgi:GTP-binding protein YchF|nr:redox-regulated ATPase YchF [Puniceicoccales bacterium]
MFAIAVYMLQAGIVGLPNVGKSTLFNALTRSRKAEAQNYPFCTIDPNVGVIEVPDARLDVLAALSRSRKKIPATVEIVDIAGLVAGASKGEGLGNKFLANIREVDAIIHVVRCFENSKITHTTGTVDPVRDIETVNTELLLADLQSIESQLDRNVKKMKGDSKDAKENAELLRALREHLNSGSPATSFAVDDGTAARIKSFHLLTAKPVIFACNVDEIHGDVSESKFVNAVRAHTAKCANAPICTVCVQTESDVCELSPVEAEEFLKEFGIGDSGTSQLVSGVYSLLGLASFFTTGEDETRAWTFRIGMKAPQCAGVIHGDFEAGFIKAEIVDYGELVAHRGWNGARDAGKIRLEGKDYRFKDGDVAIFRFNG